MHGVVRPRLVDFTTVPSFRRCAGGVARHHSGQFLLHFVHCRPSPQAMHGASHTLHGFSLPAFRFSSDFFFTFAAMNLVVRFGPLRRTPGMLLFAMHVPHHQDSVASLAF
jgi:hypothetical protein